MMDVHSNIINDLYDVSNTETSSEGSGAKDEDSFFDPNFLGWRVFERTLSGWPGRPLGVPRPNKDTTMLDNDKPAGVGDDYMIGEDLERLNIELMLSSPALKRLSSRINSRLRLDYFNAHCLKGIKGAADTLYQPSPRRWTWPRVLSIIPQSAIAVMNWHPEDFIAEQGYTYGPESLAKVLTITGSASQCQLLSCLDYARQVWPITGEDVIQTVIEACDKEGPTKQSK